MDRLVLPENGVNGGFPEPPEGAKIRVVAARHDACGTATRVRLPSSLSARAVRRFECAGCAAEFEAPAQEVKARKPALPKLALPKLELPTLGLPTLKLPSLDPESRSWKLISIPIAAVLVIAALLLLRGDDEVPAPAVTAPAPVDSADDQGRSTPEPAPIAKPSKNTEFVRESSFSLALPAGWQRIDPPSGATFAAVAPQGAADATLWIEQDPKLDFAAFTAQSIDQLEALAGSARVVERTGGPTLESNLVRLAADAPAGQPTYEVVLRAAGPYRYYLAISVQPDASAKEAEATELIAGTLTPELGS